MKFDARDQIESRPEVMGGKPVFKGTRVPLDCVLREFAVGMSPEEILAEYPSLRPEHLRAAMALAAREALAAEAVVG